MQQLAVCGRCTICEAFAKARKLSSEWVEGNCHDNPCGVVGGQRKVQVRGLWQKLKAAAQRVVKGIIKAKRTLFGFLDCIYFLTSMLCGLTSSSHELKMPLM